MAEQTTTPAAAPATAANPLACPTCGKVMNCARGLTRHITVMHKHPVNAAAPKAARKPAQPRGARRAAAPVATPLATAGDPAEAATALFEAVARQMEASDALTTACIDGLELLAGKLKALRLAYLKKADKVRQLTAQVQALRWEAHQGKAESEGESE